MWLDVSSYCLTRFKTGQYPVIVRDTVYLSYRRQRYTDLPTSGDQTKLQTLRATSGLDRDTVEALTFLRSGTLAAGTITVGGQASGYTAAAGVQAKTVPLAYGSASVSVNRSGAVVAAVSSPWTVSAQFASQELQYCAVRSRRQP